MIKFKTISINSYKAIDNLIINLEPGIIKVVGVNNDDPYDSNGAGKTTAVQAIGFALFNKDFNGAPVDSLGNRTLGTSPKVTVTFTNTVTGRSYEVCNDKQGRTHDIVDTTDGSSATPITGSLEVQKEVTRVLGMSYKTFKLTHFITSSTINAIAENLSQPVIFNDLLQISEFQALDKTISDVNKELIAELSALTGELDSLLKSQELLEVAEKFNKDDINSQIATINEELLQVEVSYAEIASKVEPKITFLGEEVSIKNRDIASLTTTLREGICTTCNSILTDANNVTSIRTELEQATREVVKQKEQLAVLGNSFNLVKAKYKNDKAEALSRLAELQTNFSIALEIEKLHSGTLQDNTSSITLLEERISTLRTLIAFYSEARKEIKSGNIVQELMTSFFTVVEARMLEYLTILNLGSFYINLSSDNLGMKINITKMYGKKLKAIPIETLSNGEKTRLSLLILISMLDAMKIVSNCETNYLVFDEASSSFDKSGVEELSTLFSHLKNLGQSCFLITHGQEMDRVSFDYELIMTKTVGKSSGTLTKL